MRGPLAAAALALATALLSTGAASAGAAATPVRPEKAPVTIGLFVPMRGAGAPEGAEAAAAAEIAIEAANANGGVLGKPLRLVKAPSDLPWAQASSSLVDLIYDEGASAVVGALDGRSAHLAEQVIVRARGEAVFVTPWATETGLSRIGIPWFFRVAPDDREQARLMAGEIYAARGIQRVALWVEDSFDARSVGDAFSGAAPPGSAVAFDERAAGATEDLLARAARSEFGAIVLCAGPEAGSRMAERLRRAGSRALLAGPLRLSGPGFDAAGPAGQARIVAPASGDARAAASFDRAWRGRRGTPPTPLALYTRDAVALIVEAMIRSERAGGPSLQEALAAARIDGLTGKAGFDDRRDRSGSTPVIAGPGEGAPAREATAARPARGSGGRR